MKRRKLLLGLLAAKVAYAGSVDHSYDVIVVGSGAAGLSAAVSAVENGARRVLVLEKETTLGGHTMVSTGYVSALSRKNVSQKDYEASAHTMLEGMRRLADGRGNEALQRKLVYESADIIEWLASMGLRWEDNVFQTLAGLAPRSYISSAVRAGYDYITTLNKRARSLGVEVRFSTRAMQIKTGSDNRIVGLVVQSESQSVEFEAPTVILATGGYGGNVAMRSRYVPWLDARYPTTANPYFTGTDCATGDGIKMGAQLGAALVDMDCIMVIPFWGGRLTDYVGADIYVDAQGRRFVNEGSSWNEISTAIRKLPNEQCWVITDSQSIQGASRSSKIMNGIVSVANTVEEMAAGMGVDKNTLRQTLERYNSFARKGIDEDFGKNMFTQEINKPPYFYGKERLYVHYCCGGLRIDEHARVLSAQGIPIGGLYAAGETTGGVHGKDRLGGCSITDCFVFGREAGKSGARYALQAKANLV
mgnify:FL=1|jgi:flavocytochrome c